MVEMNIFVRYFVGMKQCIFGDLNGQKLVYLIE